MGSSYNSYSTRWRIGFTAEQYLTLNGKIFYAQYTDTDVVFDVADDIDLDFSDDTLDNLHDISEINMDNGSANSIDGITLDDILEMTDDNNTLTITGDDNDMLNIDTNGWEQTTPAITNADTGMTTYEYANTSGDIITLNIDEQIHSTGM